MLRTIALIAAALVTGNILSQEDRQSPTTDLNATVPPATALRDRTEPLGEELRLADDAITEEAINRLAGGTWSKVELSADRIDASVIEALRHAASIRTLGLFGGRFSGQIPRLQHVKGLAELTLAGSLNGHDLEGVWKLLVLAAPHEQCRTAGFEFPEDFVPLAEVAWAGWLPIANFQTPS